MAGSHDGEMNKITNKRWLNVLLYVSSVFTIIFISLSSDPDIADQGQVLVVVTASVGGFSLLVILTLFLLITGRSDINCFSLALDCKYKITHSGTYTRKNLSFLIISNNTTSYIQGKKKNLNGLFFAAMQTLIFQVAEPIFCLITSSLLHSINLRQLAQTVVFSSPLVHKVLPLVPRFNKEY